MARVLHSHSKGHRGGRPVGSLYLSHLPSYHVSPGVSQSGLLCRGSFLKRRLFPPLPLPRYLQPLPALLRLFLRVGLPSEPTRLCQGCLRGLCVDSRANSYAIISEGTRAKNGCLTNAWRACADIQCVNISRLAPRSIVALTWTSAWVLRVPFFSSADLFITIATSCSTSRSSRSCSTSKC